MENRVTWQGRAVVDQFMKERCLQYLGPGDAAELVNLVLSKRTAVDGPTLFQYERACLVDALAKTGNNYREVAKLVDCSRSALYDKLRRHGLFVKAAKTPDNSPGWTRGGVAINGKVEGC